MMTGLKYTLLAGLHVEPRSGYALTQWMARAAHHYWAADHSSIYPALASLEREGFVTHTLLKSERGPKRKVYALTARGTEALKAWAEIPAQDPEVRDEQIVKVLCYNLLPREKAIGQFQVMRARYQEKAQMFKELLRHLDAEEQGDPERSVERLGARLALRRGVITYTSYVRWCDDSTKILNEEKTKRPRKKRT